MDPLSIIASCIAIATPVAISLQKLRDARHAKADLLMLANEVAEIVVLLQEIQQIIVQQNATTGRTRPSVTLVQAVDASKVKLEQLSSQISEWDGSAAPHKVTMKGHGLRWIAMSFKVNSFKEDFRRIRSSLKAVLQTMTLSGTARVEMSVQEVFVFARDISASQQVAHTELQSSLSRQHGQMEILLRNLSQSANTSNPRPDAPGEGHVQGVQNSNREDLNYENYVRAFHHNGSVLFNSAQMTAVAAVGIRTTQFPRTSCIPWCSCACHKERRLRTPRMLEQFIGSLFIGYSGLPVLRPPCNEQSCHLQAQPLTYVTYFFPRWFLSRMVTFMMTVTPLAGPVVSLKVQRTVPGNADIFTYAKLGDVDKIRMLFENGLASPHDIAVNHQHVRTCKLLLQANADPFMSDRSQCTSADNAQTKILSKTLSPTDGQTLREMFSETECVERREFTILHKIVLGLVSKDLERELEASTSEINVQEIIGRTPLSMAAEKNETTAVAALLRYGADPNIFSYALVSPLHYAVCARDPECAQLLLEAGTEVDCVTNWDQTPLIYAAAYTRDSRHAMLLLDAGAKPNFRDLDGMTALHWCAISNNPEVASVLLARGADIEIIDKAESSALQQCITANRHEVLKLLVEKRPRVEACIPETISIAHLIAANADEETMRLCGQLDLSRLLTDQDNISGMSATEVLARRPDYSSELRAAFDALVQTEMSLATDDDEPSIGDEEEEEWEDAVENHERPRS